MTCTNIFQANIKAKSVVYYKYNNKKSKFTTSVPDEINNQAHHSICILKWIGQIIGTVASPLPFSSTPSSFSPSHHNYLPHTPTVGLLTLVKTATDRKFRIGSSYLLPWLCETNQKLKIFIDLNQNLKCHLHYWLKSLKRSYSHLSCCGRPRQDCRT